MPAPVIPIVGAVLAAVGPWIGRFLAAKGVTLFAGFLLRAGMVLATNELLLQPVIDYAMAAWSGIPQQFQCWLALLGITKAAGIYVSAFTLMVTKKIFFQKA